MIALISVVFLGLSIIVLFKAENRENKAREHLELSKIHLHEAKDILDSATAAQCRASAMLNQAKEQAIETERRNKFFSDALERELERKGEQ